MFTGIITEQGTIEEILPSEANRLFRIQASPFFCRKDKGASIAIDGVCLTLVAADQTTFTVEAVQETLSRTLCGRYRVGDKINLEGSLTLGGEISGHLVAGHVDTLALVKAVHSDKGQIKISFTLPSELKSLIAFKGSVTINGVSLTVSELQNDFFAVTIIPHTSQSTNLGRLQSGDSVNLEVDYLARYVRRCWEVSDEQANYSYLLENGFL